MTNSSESAQRGREVVRWSSQPAWSEYVFLWFVTVVFGARSAVLIWYGQWSLAAIHVAGMVIFVGLAVFFHQTTRYVVTQDALYRTTGVLGHREDRVPLSDIASVDVRQTGLDRLLGIGTLYFYRKDDTSIRFAGLRDPEVVQRKVEALFRPTKRD